MTRIAWMTVLMAGPYFLTMNYPAFEPTFIPTSNFDRTIPLIPHFSWIYFSFYFFLCLPVVFCQEAIVRKTIFGYLWLVGISNFIFYFWPTAVHDFRGGSGNFGMELITRFDNGTNACPSLHGSLTIFCALIISKDATRFQRFGIWAWAILILASTLFTKQHMVLDVAVGTLLGAFTHYVVRSQIMAVLLRYRSTQGDHSPSQK